MDQGKEVRVVFCDISKAFDKVWHKGLLHKLESAGITGILLDWFKSYLSGRSQRVCIRGKQSDLAPILAGVPQGSILGPLLFLIFINDIISDIESNIRLFADDTCLYIDIDDPIESTDALSRDLTKLSSWARKWKVDFSPSKTFSLMFSRLRENASAINPLTFLNKIIANVNSHKHLGLTLRKDCLWRDHIDTIVSKASKRLDVLQSLKNKLDRRALQTIYFAFIRPILEYSNIVFCNLLEGEADELEAIQLRAARIVTGARRGTSHALLYLETGWEKLSIRRTRHQLIQFYKIINGIAPQYLRDLIPSRVGSSSRYPLRNSDNLTLIKATTNNYHDSFLPSTTVLWNSLSLDIRQSPTLSSFKASLRGRDTRPPTFYFQGTRINQIIHCQLRLGCSTLNGHLFANHCIPDPACDCGASNESTYHYFFLCPIFEQHRNRYITPLNAPLNVLLYGDSSESLQFNCNIFEQVHYYIGATSRLQL